MKSVARESAKARKSMDQALRQMENRVTASEDRIGRSFEGLGDRLSAGLKGAGIGAAAAVVKQLADQWTEAGNKIVAAGVPLAEQGQKLEELSRIAERSRTAFSATADLYARLSRSAKDLGASQAEISVATETVAKALKLAGASAGETESTLVQLGQALGSGRLQGDELRSLLENAPVLTQALSKEFGVAVGELKKLGEEGQLTSDRVFKALVNANSDIEGAFAKTKATGTDAFKSLEAAAVRYIGQSSTVATATTAVTSAVQLLASNLTLVADGATALGAVIAARLIGQGLTPAVAAMGAQVTAAARATAGLNALNVTLLATTARLHAAALASRVAGAALALVGGPVGAAILGAAAAAVYFSSESAKAAERSRQYAAALEEVGNSAQSSGKAIDEHTNAVIRAARAQAEQRTNELNKGINEATNDAAKFEGQIKQLLAGYSAFSSKIKDPADVRSLQRLAGEFDGTAESALKTKEELYRLANANPNFQEIADRLGPVLNAFAGAISLVRKLKAELGGVADEVAKAGEKAIEAAIPNPAKSMDFDSVMGMGRSDPIVQKLQGQAAVRQAVAEAEMNETAKKIRDTRQKLFDEITKGGGTVDPLALDAAAKRIVAAEESSKKGPKSDAQKDADRIKQYTVSLQEEQREIEAEAAALGKSNLEKQIAINLARAGASATDEQKNAIIASTSAIENARVAIENYEKAQQEANKTAEYFGDIAVDAISDLALEGKTLEDVFKNVAKSIAHAALQAAILGKGPLAGLFGTSGSDGGLGGIIGMIAGAFGGGSKVSFNPTGRAGGGLVKPGTAYKFEELGKQEGFVSTTPGRIIPHNRLGGGPPIQFNVINEAGVPLEQQSNDSGGIDVIIPLENALADRASRGKGSLYKASTGRAGGRTLRG